MDLMTPVEPDVNEARRPVDMGIGGPDLGAGRGPVRPEDRARELDAEVARLLRVRGGELAEPLLWQRPSHCHEVEVIVGQLAPIRSRLGLLSSWLRESGCDSPLRLAYAITWLRLAQRRAGEFGPRRHAGKPRPGRLAAVAR
ncbi:MAG TPA: hypothetical protein VJ850_02875 [Candidatus Limnocylindrales bacterium]|nr:hypothetical protein [Candidatus Limnocylindrales bacterium]